jgi:hypothetical protein
MDQMLSEQVLARATAQHIMSDAEDCMPALWFVERSKQRNTHKNSPGLPCE